MKLEAGIKMAERYGDIPEKFTKAWWEYFWEYYKWYVIVPLIIIIAIGTTIYGKLTAPKYDLTLTYAANNIIESENEEILTSNLSKLCDDVDENGEKSLFFTQLWIKDNPSQGDIEYARASATKLQLSFAEDQKYIYIMDNEAAQLYIGQLKEECPYAPIERWAKNIPEGTEIFSAHGVNYGISLAGNKLFEGYGIDLSDHYLIMRYYPRKDQMKKQLKGYEAAVNLANRIITEK